MKKLLWCMFLVSLALLSACDGKSDPPETNKRGTDDTTGVTPLPPKITLEGTWNGFCAEASNGESARNVYTFSGNDFEWVNEVYFDNACAVSKKNIVIGKGRYSIGDQITTSSGLAAEEFNWYYVEFLGSKTDFKKYTIYAISDGKLFFGNTTSRYDGLSEDERPISLNFDLPSTKN